MKITVLTSNQPRHVAFINNIAGESDEVFAIQEVTTLFPGKTEDFYKKSEVMQKYFQQVQRAERKFFGESSFCAKNVRTLSIKLEDLNSVTRESLGEAMDADVFIVFGSSYIKGWLIEELIDKAAINLHLGMSPYYRGASCNFWAYHDKNYHLVGSTIHRLTKGLDSGPIINHAIPKPKGCSNLFEFTMKSVLSGQQSIIESIRQGTLLKIKEQNQNREKEIRYSKHLDFTDEIAALYTEKQEDFSHKITLIEDMQARFEYKNVFLC